MKSVVLGRSFKGLLLVALASSQVGLSQAWTGTGKCSYECTNLGPWRDFNMGPITASNYAQCVSTLYEICEELSEGFCDQRREAAINQKAKEIVCKLIPHERLPEYEPEAPVVPLFVPGLNVWIKVESGSATFRSLNEFIRIWNSANWKTKALLGATAMVFLGAIVGEVIGSVGSFGGTLTLTPATLSAFAGAIVAICVWADIPYNTHDLNAYSGFKKGSRAVAPDFDVDELEPNVWVIRNRLSGDPEIVISPHSKPKLKGLGSRVSKGELDVSFKELSNS